MIKKCLGFCIRMNQVQILVQTLYETSEITKSFYTSEPISAKLAIPICLAGCERIRNRAVKSTHFLVRWVWVRRDCTFNSLSNLSLRCLTGR